MPVNIGSEKAKLYLGEIEISGGGSSLDHTATFKVNNADYAIHSMVSGSTIQAPTVPNISGYVFKGWKSGSQTISFPFTPTLDEYEFTAELQLASYGSISGFGSSNPSAVSFSIQDGLFDGIEEITFAGDVFIKFPKMYRKVVSSVSGQITEISIANAQIDSSYHIYPCFLDENGNELEYVLMGKYPCTSSTRASSVSGSYVTMTIGTGRTICRNRGTGYQQMDWMIFKLWQDLLVAKMKTINTNSGSGFQTDQLGVFWGSDYPWIDGVSCQSSSKKWVFSYKPSKYANEATSSTDGYVEASYSFSGTSGREISKLGYDANNEFFNYPASTTDNSSYNTYYCDAFYFGSSATNPVRSFVGRAVADSGAFSCDASNGWTYTYGVRLCYRPLSA